jgi:hypothetical protein
MNRCAAILPALLLLASPLLADQARYRVTLNGAPIGEAFLDQSVGADGVKSVSVRMELRVSGQPTTVRQQSSYSPSGVPIRSFQEMVQGKTRRSVITNYNAAGASLVTEAHGERKLSTAPLDARQPRAQMAEFWFVRDKPKSGERYEAYQLNPGSVQWELTDVTYMGDRRVRFESASRTMVATYDAHGMPIMITDSGGTVLSRIEKPTQ